MRVEFGLRLVVYGDNPLACLAIYCTEISRAKYILSTVHFSTVFFLVFSGRYCTGEPGFIPATPLGVLEILKRCQVETFGKTACVVGRSKNIGKFERTHCSTQRRKQ